MEESSGEDKTYDAQYTGFVTSPAQPCRLTISLIQMDANGGVQPFETRKSRYAPPPREPALNSIHGRLLIEFRTCPHEGGGCEEFGKAPP